MSLAFKPELVDELFDVRNKTELRSIGRVDFEQITSEFTVETLNRLTATEILITGWSCPVIDTVVLDALPNLKAIVHSAGSLKFFLPEEAWHRGITISSAASANAVPVAEYAVASILFAGKGAFSARQIYRNRRGAFDRNSELKSIGNYQKVLGIVGASTIGRLVISKLAESDLIIQVADPYLSAESAIKLGVKKVSLTELFSTSDIISIHAPLLPETEGMITSQLIQSMRTGSTLINTARGALIDEFALIEELETGRISAVIDTTHPEIPTSESKLFDLPNVFLTPHIAGALGNEIARLGAFAVNEIKLLGAGQPLLGQVSLEQFKFMA